MPQYAHENSRYSYQCTVFEIKQTNQNKRYI